MFLLIFYIWIKAFDCKAKMEVVSAVEARVTVHTLAEMLRHCGLRAAISSCFV